MDCLDWVDGAGRLLVVAALVGCATRVEDVPADEETGTSDGSAVDSGSSGRTSGGSSGDDTIGSEDSSGPPLGCQDWEVPTITALQPDTTGAGDGSFWVAGSNEDTNSQWVLGRYDADGTMIAAGEAGGRLADTLRSVAAGPDLGVYALGRQDDHPESRFPGGDTVLARFDADGNEVWSLPLELGDGVRSNPVDVTVTEDGSAYAVGRAFFAVDFEEGPTELYSFVAKIGPTGEQEWFELLFGSETFINQATVTTPDRAGGVYVLGDSSGTLEGEAGAGNFDIWVARYAANGTREWFTMIGAELRESVRDAVADSQGNLYIAAHVDPGVGPEDIPLLMKLDGSGEQQWALESDVDATRLTSLAVDTTDVLYASYGVLASDTLATYDTDGTRLTTRALDDQLQGLTKLVHTTDDALYFADDRAGDGHFLVHICRDDS